MTQEYNPPVDDPYETKQNNDFATFEEVQACRAAYARYVATDQLARQEIHLLLSTKYPAAHRYLFPHEILYPPTSVPPVVVRGAERPALGGAERPPSSTGGGGRATGEGGKAKGGMLDAWWGGVKGGLINHMISAAFGAILGMAFLIMTGCF